MKLWWRHQGAAVLTGFPVLGEDVMHIPLRLKSELKQLLIK